MGLLLVVVGGSWWFCCGLRVWLCLVAFGVWCIVRFAFGVVVWFKVWCGVLRFSFWVFGCFGVAALRVGFLWVI